jgi:1,4-alpha-glucan branching enzyme
MGFYREVLNTDSGTYGGSNVGNFGGAHASPIACFGRPYSINLTLPPLATVFLKIQHG